MGKGLLAVLGFVGLLFLGVLMVGCSFVTSKNQMVAKDQAVKTAWSDVDVQLQRRADLIPNLVETVKGFTKEESTVFGDIANARAGMLNAQGPAAKIQANGQLDGAIGRLLHEQRNQGMTLKASADERNRGAACRERHANLERVQLAFVPDRVRSR